MRRDRERERKKERERERERGLQHFKCDEYTELFSSQRDAVFRVNLLLKHFLSVARSCYTSNNINQVFVHDRII